MFSIGQKRNKIKTMGNRNYQLKNIGHRYVEKSSAYTIRRTNRKLFK